MKLLYLSIKRNQMQLIENRKLKRLSHKASVKHGHISDSGSIDYNVTEKFLLASGHCNVLLLVCDPGVNKPTLLPVVYN